MEFPFSKTSQFYLPHPSSDNTVVSLVINVPQSELDWFNEGPSDSEELSKYSTIVKVVNEMIIPRVKISSADEQTSSKKKDQPPNMIPTSSFLSERDPTASDMLLEYSIAKVKNYGMVNGKDVSFEVVIEVRREIEND
ncbi:hypothetical protein TrVE_jg12459 [Triparma verrucosa]|uniref:Uncharacterized protein n=2 Tax=Triparma TaxID=722752 RepID=A0A9W7E1A8_9STRA|nr:hypothetical protein TrST_g5503 [Triparma strigata]GMH87366.1 hypothetical protein TrVE_jg12459 [Triparma verrucosa]